LENIANKPLAAAVGAIELIRDHTTAWSAEFTRGLLAKMNKTMSDYSDNQSYAFICALTETTGKRAPAELVEEILPVLCGWQEAISETAAKTPYYGPAWIRQMNEAIDLLKLRRDFLKAVARGKS
jgi:hypothetical protein